MFAENDHPGYRTTTEDVLSRTDIDIRGKTFLVTGGTSGLGMFFFLFPIEIIFTALFASTRSF